LDIHLSVLSVDSLLQKSHFFDYGFSDSGFSRDPDLPSGEWSDLKPYRVGILIGWKILETNIAGTRSLRKVDDMENLFGMLEGDHF